METVQFKESSIPDIIWRTYAKFKIKILFLLAIMAYWINA